MSRAASRPLRVVIADDHPYYRRGLTRSLQASGIEVAAEAQNGESAVLAVLETGPDVVIMDLNMPTVSGLEATRRLIEQAPEIRVLILTVSADVTDLADAILAGARGYVLKDRPVQEVVEAVRTTAEGGAPISPLLAMPLLRRLRGPTGEVETGDAELHAVEHDLLALIAGGHADHEIADALVTTEAEVRALASSILAKLRPDRRAEAALRASRNRPA